LEDMLPEGASVRELFECQQKLAESRDLVERLSILWIAALLGERLEQCSDHEIAELLPLVQHGLGIFSAEFAVCEFAKRRLQRYSPQSDTRQSWR
jgi:hypothetical protein